MDYVLPNELVDGMIAAGGNHAVDKFIGQNVIHRID